ncbi:MAG: L-2-amino-thiazoline-4-carboxylic acid hydrolase [Candidatus Thorarchaeota archaeon]
MTLDYESFNSYNSEATIEINLHSFTLRTLKRLEQTLESILDRSQSTINEFAEQVISAWSRNEGAADVDYSAIDLDEIKNELPIISEELELLLPASRLILSHLIQQKGVTKNPEDSRILYIDREKAENILFYEMVRVLVELLGREEGIRVYKDAVDSMADKQARLEPDLTKISQFSKNFTSGLAESGGFSFAVAGIDDGMLLGKFDKCVVHESLKNVSDPEVGYLVTCYTGMVTGNRRNQNVQMRRTHTLFSGDFCDELYWDPKLHKDPAQPPLEFSRKLRVD